MKTLVAPGITIDTGFTSGLPGVVCEIGRRGKETFNYRFFRRLEGLYETFDIVKEIDDPRTVQSDVDLMASALFGGFFAHFPGMRVITEEKGISLVPGTGYESYRAVVDDWDGSNNGVRGANLSAISVGIDYDGAPAFGVWYNPYRDFLIAHRESNAFLSCGRSSFSFRRAPLGATSLDTARLIIHRGTKQHPVSDLTKPPLANLASRVMAMVNFESSVVALMDVALGIFDGFVVAGNESWDLWAARPIFNALSIPYAFMEPFTYRSLRPDEIVPEPGMQFAFACANNPTLFAEIMAILQSL